MDKIRKHSDIDVYKRMTELHLELEAMADQCWSVAGATALRGAARILRMLSSGFFLSLKGAETPFDALARTARLEQSQQPEDRELPF
jgi:hypothetical protein